MRRHWLGVPVVVALLPCCVLSPQEEGAAPRWAQAISPEEAAAREAATATKAAWNAKDFDAYQRLATRSVLEGRVARDAALLDRLRGTVAIAQSAGAAGLEGSLLSLVGEARSRGVAAGTLRSLVQPLAGYKYAPATAGQPAWVPVAATAGYGARYLRLSVARTALASLLGDPLRGLERALEDGLCSLSLTELEARLGQHAAADVRRLCDGGAMGASGVLGGPMLTATTDFDCLLQEAGHGLPTFDEQVTQAAMECAESMGVSNPYADGDRVVRTWEFTYPDGTKLWGWSTEDGHFTEKSERPNGCTETVTMLPNNAFTILQTTPNQQARQRKYDENGKLISDERTPGYDGDCATCEDSGGELIAGEPIVDPSTQVASGDPIDTPACDAFDDLLYQHAGKPIPAPGAQRPRDWVTYPTPDAAPATDVTACLALLGDIGVKKTSAACGLQLCPLGSVSDPDAGCACTPVAARFEADAMGVEGCERILRCEQGSATARNGVCVCPSGDAHATHGRGGLVIKVLNP